MQTSKHSSCSVARSVQGRPPGLTAVQGPVDPQPPHHPQVLQNLHPAHQARQLVVRHAEQQRAQTGVA